MDESFNINEKLYRAVYPPEVMQMYWKRDGSVSSAAFADPYGLSVDRGDYREDEEVVSEMKKRFAGSILFVYVKNCREAGAIIYYLPSKKNIYHSEIHGSKDCKLLSKHQRRYLATHCRLVYGG